MASAARRQITGGGAPINKSRRRRRPQIVGGAAQPAHSSIVPLRDTPQSDVHSKDGGSVLHKSAPLAKRLSK